MQPTLSPQIEDQPTELERRTENRRFQYWVVLFAYVTTFSAIYYDLSISVRFAVAALLIILQFFSFHSALIILFLALFMPFTADLLGEGVLRFHRLALIPFAFHAFRARSVRKFPANRQVLFLILLSLVVIKITADLQVIYQISKDPTHNDYSKGLLNYTAEYFDISVVLFLLYTLFTKFETRDIHYFFKSALWAVTLQGITIIYIAATNFNDVLLQTRGSRILWDSPLFRHKQYWGPLFCIVFLIHFITYFNARRKNLSQLFPIIITLITLFVSLSRTAYLGVLIGIGVFAVRSKNLKKLVYIFGITLLLLPIALQIDFVNDRIESMTAADDVGEFQDQSAGHFSDAALEQYANNFTFVPQIFYVPWEFNYSEGFWNGLLHQSGIIGLFLVLLVFWRLFRRLNFLYRNGDSPTRTFAIIGITLIPLFIVINLINRNGFFMDYYGDITNYGILLTIIYLYAELMFKENTEAPHAQ